MLTWNFKLVNQKFVMSLCKNYRLHGIYIEWLMEWQCRLGLLYKAACKVETDPTMILSFLSSISFLPSITDLLRVIHFKSNC